MLMKKRLTYEAPEVELVLVRFEDNFLQATGGEVSSLSFGYNGDAGAGSNVNDAGSF